MESLKNYKMPRSRRLLPIANLVALAVTLVINFLSNTGVFAHATTGSVSAKYPSLFTPANYAFGIWFLIYAELIWLVIYLARGGPGGRESAGEVGWWFVLSCAANCGWILAWVNEEIGLSVVIMVFLLFCLLRIVWRTNMELTDPPLRVIAGLWWPVCYYSGWITAAFFADLSAWLVKSGWEPYVLHQEAWTLGMIVAAVAVYLWMTWRRNMREYGFMGVWALVAVGVNDWTGAQTVSLAAWGGAAILFISSSWHAYRNRAYSPWTWSKRHGP
jgi:hypothetical protein